MSDNIGDAKLLPDNATQLEKDVDSLFDYEETVESSVDNARIAKLQDVPDSFVPWLVYEYGLEEVLPWVTDPREAMRSGIRWQRIKGTPESLRIALSWVGFTAEQVEEEETGQHYFEFQIELDGVPIGNTLIDSIMALSKLSAPLRSRLSRLYNEVNDVRRFKLDSSPWGDLLSDYSGIKYQDGTRLSFGRYTVDIGELDGVTSTQTHTRRTGVVAGLYEKWPVLSGEFDYLPEQIVAIGKEHGDSATYDGQIWTGNTWPESTTWGDINIIVGVNHVSNS